MVWVKGLWHVCEVGCSMVMTPVMFSDRLWLERYDIRWIIEVNIQKYTSYSLLCEIHNHLEKFGRNWWLRFLVSSSLKLLWFIGKLRELDLSFNKFANIPDCVSLQLCIQSLNMEGNEVVHIGREFVVLQNLRTLNLARVCTWQFALIDDHDIIFEFSKRRCAQNFAILFLTRQLATGNWQSPRLWIPATQRWHAMHNFHWEMVFLLHNKILYFALPARVPHLPHLPRLSIKW